MDSPIHKAIKDGKGRDEVERLLKSHASSLSTANRDGDTPLHLAANARREGIYDLLVAAGSNLSAINKRGQSILHIAAKLGLLRIVRESLVTAGLNMLAQDIEGQTPLHISIIAGNELVTTTLIASEVSYYDSPQLPIAHGRLSTSDNEGNTPLFLALDHHQEEIAQLLIDSGADLLSVNGNNRNLLHAAAKSSCEMVKRLIKAGLSVSLPDTRGDTPLHLALAHHSPAVARVLITAGADVGAMNLGNVAPLNLATSRCFPDIVDMLIAGGASTASHPGITPPLNAALRQTFYTSDKDRERMALTLIAGGADVSSVDDEDLTPLQRAMSGGYPKAVQALLAMGADVSNIASRGKIFGQIFDVFPVVQGNILALLLNNGADGDRLHLLLQTLKAARHSSVDALRAEFADPNGPR